MSNDKSALWIEVEEALESIRPYLITDGGNITLMDITPEMVVKVRLEGACRDCNFRLQTLRGGVEMVVKSAVPQIVEVVSVV